MLKMTLLFTVSILFLMSCTSTPTVKKNARCSGVDWWEVGRTDGVAGTALDRGLQEHSQRCEGAEHPFAVDLYQNGRDTGLIDYCAPAQGFLAGQAGSTYEKVCPAYLEAAFLQQYEIGKRIRVLETEEDELVSRIDDLEKLLVTTKTGTALKMKIEELRARQLKLDTEISKIEASADPESKAL